MATQQRPAADLIALPQGGGAIRGLGETFSPDLQTGTGNFSIPLAVPVGRRGLQPTLTLEYSTGSGNGMYGLGWSMSVPGISRKTARGVPRYDGHDTFVLAGNEDLVPVESIPGGGVRYQPRTESLFARIVHWSDPAASQDFWEVTTRDGVLSRYGTERPLGAPGEWRDPAVVADPGDPRRIFAWKLTLTRDPLGNHVRYDYADDAGEDGNHRWRQPILRSIRYADYPTADGHTEYLVTVTFDDEPREDAFSSYSAGFEVRTSRRYRSMTTAVHPGQTRPVRRYEFTYQAEPYTGMSMLTAVAVVGFSDTGGHGAKEYRDLPSLRLRYSGLDLTARRFQPVTGPDLPAGGLDGDDLELIDVTGDGRPDIMQWNGSLRYWRNLGEGGFDRPRPMSDAPAGFSLADPNVQLLDADGDGRADLMVTTPTASGYFPLRFGPRWGPFRPHRQSPTVSLKDPRIKLVDLDGDGVTDALYDSADLLCFFNDERAGWSHPHPVTFAGSDRPPPLSFADHRVRWADLTGDGLTDLVLVHAGGVDYWPNLGHGRFGNRLRMPGAPWLPSDYDPKMLQLGDVDGDGLADAVYAGADGVTIWFNCGGNRWSPPVRVRGVPANRWNVRITDLLATGTGGVLFSRKASRSGSPSMYFLDLSAGVKPRLLTEVDNQMGAVTHIQYRAAAAYARACDSRLATRWRTTLPIAVPVVARVEVRDDLARSRLTRTYTYRHGYYDGVEREFRGFGRVEQVDAETVPGIDAPPTMTRTWFHLGPVDIDKDDEWRPLVLDDEYWAGDRSVLDHSGPARFLTGLRGATSAEGRRFRRDALRALRGRVLRTELYGLDGSAAQDRPYTVTEHSYELRAEAAGVFFAFESARRTTHWERGDDPMSTFDFAGDHDAYGQPRQQTIVAAPRRSARRSPWTAAMVGTFAPDPTALLATHTHTEYAQSPPDAWMHDRVAAVRRYEPAHEHTVNETSPADVRAVLADQQLAAAALRDRFGRPTAADVRLIGHVVHHYDGPAYTGRPLGELGEYGLLTRSETLVFPDNVIEQGYGDMAPGYIGGAASLPAGAPADFGADLGYRHEPAGQGYEAGWYADTVRYAHDVQISTAAQPLPGRGIVLGVQDSLRREVRVTPDPYWLLPAVVRDAAGLSTTVWYDYRTGQPSQTLDPNGHMTTYHFNPLGLLTSVYVTGRDGTGGTAERPETRYSYDLLTYVERRQPVYVHTTRRVWHASDGRSDEVVESREYFDGLGRTVQTRTQADELAFGDDGNDVGLLVDNNGGAAEPVPGRASPTATGTLLADRVVVSGWSVRDNKGRAVQRYEPFFARGWAFQPASESQRGQCVTTVYDPRGRVALVHNPDGSLRRTVFGVPVDLDDPDATRPTPWTVTEYDENDLAPATGPLAEKVPTDLRFLPVTRILDGLGRDVCRIARGGVASQTWTAERRTYDAHGNILSIVDEFGRTAFENAYDLTDRPMRVDSIDAGRRITVLDAAGLPVHTQDKRGCLTLRTYDMAGRPAGVYARDSATAALTLRERCVYGDTLPPGPDRDVAVAGNGLGRVWLQDDEAGRVQIGGYDLAGRVREQTRSVVSDAAIAAGWTANWAAADAEAALDTELLRTVMNYDALGRVVSLVTPTGGTLTSTYGRYGALRSVALDGVPYLRSVLYNARGQRVLVDCGNGLITRYAYDPATFRLARLRTERAPTQQGPAGVETWTGRGAPLQDLTYTYDLVGNVTRVDVRTPGCGVAGTPDGRDALTRIFRYDAFGRLVSATGRACVDLGRARPRHNSPRCGVYGAPYMPAPAAPGQANAPDITALYNEKYTYDPAGNLLDLFYRPTTGTVTTGWHRRFGLGGQTPHDWAAAPNNRLTSVRDGGAPTVALGYDDAGNMDSEHKARTYRWNHAGRLVGLRVGTSVAARYLYGADGALVKKWVRKGNSPTLDESIVSIGGHTEYHRWTKKGGGEHQLLHVLDGATRVAMIRTGPAHPDDASPPIRWEFGDHLGSMSVTTDDSGVWINREEYLPYGETSFGGFSRKRFRFTGHEMDAELGAYRIGNRYLRVGLARWSSCDPAGPVDGPNLYAYVRNNPMRYVDSTGTQAADAGQPPQSAAITNTDAGQPPPADMPDQGKPVEVDIAKLAKDRPQDFADITRRATAAYSKKELMRGEKTTIIKDAKGNVVKGQVEHDYDKGKTVTLEHSGRQSVVEYHCTDFVYNVFYKAGGEPPTGSPPNQQFWKSSKEVLASLDSLQKKGLVERVDTPRDNPKTPGDESTANIRPGDIAVWNPGPGEDFGHHMLIVGTNPRGAGTLKVNEAGTKVLTGTTEPVFPAGRDAAVYRLTKFDASRTARLYATDPAFHQAFNDAFHAGLRLDLPQYRAYLK
jgi:RHS repeat-associated protein